MDLAEKEAITNIFTELKNPILKELKRSIITITHQIETKSYLKETKWRGTKMAA